MTGFLTPSSIWLADAARGTASQLKTLAPRFDASRSVVEQMEATSKDGTKVPYFIVHPKSMARDGANPTILYAYGGFNASMTPRYDPDVGKLWVEQGGVYVLANIRGGGEFGPAWHEAGLKTRRQVIYDDFAAVARGPHREEDHLTATPRDSGRLQRRAADGRAVHAASGAVERGRHPGAAPRHAALREDPGRRVVGRRIRQRVEPGGARVPRVDLAVSTISRQA